ncbi:MAG: ketopantoate reductase family protein [Eubacteriales bacterium]
MIKTVSIIGLGALGTLYGKHLLDKLPKRNLRIIADKERAERYKREGIYCNGEECCFDYILPDEDVPPADLVIFAVKFGGLYDAIAQMKRQIGRGTVVLSTLNGIISEEKIAKSYGEQCVVPCVAQGMDAVKLGNKLTYKNMGILCFGGWDGENSHTKVLSEFFDSVSLPYEVDNSMKKRLWNKFMLNVGINQTTAAYSLTYGGVQQTGQARDIMLSAMREVLILSEKEGINLTRDDISYWLKVIDTLNPEGMTSMRQDTLLGRRTEVELFAGTVLRLGEKHGVDTPVNRELYDRIKAMERDI